MAESATTSRAGGMTKTPERGQALLVVADLYLFDLKFFYYLSLLNEVGDVIKSIFIDRHWSYLIVFFVFLIT